MAGNCSIRSTLNNAAVFSGMVRSVKKTIRPATCANTIESPAGTISGRHAARARYTRAMANPSVQAPPPRNPPHSNE